MIDLSKLREISRSDATLNRIVSEEPLQMSEAEFLQKFSLFWNLPKTRKEAEKP